MPIPTSRTKECAVVTIDENLCEGCGNCVKVCKDFTLHMEGNKAKVGKASVFGCIACAHCMAICPTGAVKVNGRELSSTDLITLPKKVEMTGYDAFLAMLLRRRSIREFKNKEVDQPLIDQILEAAVTAPMGLPPSDVNVLIFKGFDKNAEFAKDYSEYLKGIRYMTSPIFLGLMRPFWGKENDEMFKGFINPLFKAYVDEMKNGNNYINYDAPLAMYFYGTPYSDPADPIIAATYAMLAGETLGLGTCMLGAIHPFIQNGSKASAFRKKYGIRFKSREGLFVIFGHPAVKYHKAVKRTFASVGYAT